MRNLTKGIIVVLLLAFGLVVHSSTVNNNDRPHGLPWDRQIQPFKLSDGFYVKRGNRLHEAWDNPMPVGTPIRANFNAAIEVNWSPKAGRFILLKNGDWEVLIMHLSKYDVRNIKNGFVNYGDVIAYSGNSGESTGPHLHWSVSYRGVKINPQEIMI